MKTLMRSAALAGALLCLGAPSFGAMSASAQEAPAMTAAAHGPLLNLSAYGESKAAPDLATISLGVQTQAPTAAAAMAQNRTLMNGLMAALKKQGVAEKDIQTSGLNLSAQYAYENNQPPKLTGYQVSNTVTVTVYDLARLGQTVDAVVAGGGNQVNGISFGLKDPQAAEDSARLEAVKRLQAKAELYARATGKRIKALRVLSEGGSGVQTPQPVYRMAMKANAESTPVAPGELTLRVDVQATYELEP